MSLKSEENKDLTCSIIESLDDDEKDYNINKSSLWDELQSLRNNLSELPLKEVRQFITSNMVNDIEELRTSFKKDFEKYPNDDPLKIEILQMLGELGIIIYYE